MNYKTIVTMKESEKVTVEYAPPEQFGYAQTDVRSDIYSMGVVFNKMGPMENKKLFVLWEKMVKNVPEKSFC